MYKWFVPLKISENVYFCEKSTKKDDWCNYQIKASLNSDVGISSSISLLSSISLRSIEYNEGTEFDI